MVKHPDAKTAQKVRDCMRAGLVDRTKIAKVCKVSESILVEYYQDELDLTDSEDLIDVANVLYDMAVSGKFPHTTIYWLKTRGGEAWRETQTDAGTAANPIVVQLQGNTIDDISDDYDD